MNYEEIIKNKFITKEELDEIKHRRDVNQSFTAGLFGIVAGLIATICVFFSFAQGTDIIAAIIKGVLSFPLVASAAWGIFIVMLRILLPLPTLNIPYNSFGFIVTNIPLIDFDYFFKRVHIEDKTFFGKVLPQGTYRIFNRDDVIVFTTEEKSFSIENRIPFTKESIEIEFKILLYFRIIDPIPYYTKFDEITSKLKIKTNDFLISKTTNEGFDQSKYSNIRIEIKTLIDELKALLLENYGMFITDHAISKLTQVENNNEQLENKNSNKNIFTEIQLRIISEDKLPILFSIISKKYPLITSKVLEEYAMKMGQTISLQDIQEEYLISFDETLLSNLRIVLFPQN